MPITSNTSPVIALAKIGRLKLLRDLYGTVFVSPWVKVESVDKGKDLGAPDALEIERALEEGWVKVIELTKRQNETVQRLVSESRIGLGEAGSVAIAEDKKIAVILDDKEARALAKSWGLELTSTVMVLYEAYVRNLTSYDDLVEDLAKLSRVMWISTDVIAEVIGRARRVMR